MDWFTWYDYYDYDYWVWGGFQTCPGICCGGG